MAPSAAVDYAGLEPVDHAALAERYHMRFV